MPRLVLDGGPSDHQPFIQTFWFEHHPRWFTAVTYNVNHGSTANDVYAIFRRIRNHAPSIWLLQEVKPDSGIQELLEEWGLECAYAEPEFLIAWNPHIWDYVASRRNLMSPTEYWTLNYALTAILEFKTNKQRVEFMSYHPPAHVQSPNDPSYPKVSKALREIVKKWKRMARKANRGAKICCYAGDDNVDEFKGWEPPGGWEFMLNGPLTQVRAPKGTHGDRKIDDFRIKGLRIRR